MRHYSLLTTHCLLLTTHYSRLTTQAAIIKQGYLRKRKPGKLGAKWERRYFVLYNDGKLKYYDSRSQADEKGSLDLRFFALQVGVRVRARVRVRVRVRVRG